MFNIEIWGATFWIFQRPSLAVTDACVLLFPHVWWFLMISHSVLQARNDPFRLVRYDIATAADHAQPLLMRRHNAVPGMFLVSSVVPQCSS